MTLIIALRIILLLLVIGAGYYFWLRPLLRQRPGFKELYDQEETFFAALSEKFAGIKQKVAGAVLVLAGIAIEAQDTFVPMLTGVDTTPITSMVPPKAWPFVLIGITLLLNYFRSLCDKRKEE